MTRSAVLILGLSLCLAAYAAGPPVPAERTPIPKLVEQLGSDRFEDRERATRQLLDLEIVPVELRGALKARDLEVRRRAARIVKGIEGRLARVALAEAVDLATQGEVDQVIERVVRWAEEDPQAQGQKTLHQLVRRLAKDRRLKDLFLEDRVKWMEAVLKPPPRHYRPQEGLWVVRGLPSPLVYKNERGRGRYFLRGAGVTVQGNASGVITSTGAVKVTCGKRDSYSFIFSCGQVTVESSFITNLFLIICDGDVLIRGNLGGSLVVARGNVTIASPTTRCVVFAGGHVRQGGDDWPQGGSLIRPKDTSGLGIIKFFDPAKAGIEVTTGMGGVTVKKTVKDKPFAAVLREGDLVTAIGNAKVPSPDEFRRRLRAALAEGTRTITLTVNRSGKTLDVPVRVRR